MSLEIKTTQAAHCKRPVQLKATIPDKATILLYMLTPFKLYVLLSMFILLYILKGVNTYFKIK